MPLIKEVIFRNKKKEITFLSQSEMMESIEKYGFLNIEKNDKKASEKKVMENLNWFQKVTVDEKEFFIEKSENPLKYKDSVVEVENSGNSFWTVFLFSLFPFFITPFFLYGKIKGYFNKRKIKNGDLVYVKRMQDFAYTAFFFLITNIFLFSVLIGSYQFKLYFSVVLLNMLCGFFKIKSPYLNIENYELADFQLSENLTSNLNEINSKIYNMKSKNVTINTKIEYEFMKDLTLSYNNEEVKLNVEKDNPHSLKKFL